jgi:hypothetical protein
VDKDRKSRRIKMMVLSWMVLAGCKIPEFLSGVGKAIGDMFGSMW